MKSSNVLNDTLITITASDDVSLLTNGDGEKRPAVSTRDNCNQMLATILKNVKENNELSKEIREELKVIDKKVEAGFKELRELMGEVKELILDQGKRNTPVSKPPLRNATNDRNVGKTTDSKKSARQVVRKSNNPEKGRKMPWE